MSIRVVLARNSFSELVNEGLERLQSTILIGGSGTRHGWLDLNEGPGGSLALVLPQLPSVVVIGKRPHNTRLLSFTFSASRYTLLPISLNLALIAAMPSSMVPDTDIPTLAGSFSVAA